MIGTFHRTGAPIRTDDALVVRYRDQFPGFYLARTLPLFILFAFLAALYLDDEIRPWIFSRSSSRPKPFSWLEFGFLLALVAAPLIDLALTLMRVRPGAIALAVSPEGVAGTVRHMHRSLAWSEILDVAVDGKFLVVRRQPKSLFHAFFGSRGLGDISVPAHHLDRDVEEILAAARRFGQPQHRPAAAR